MYYIHSFTSKFFVFRYIDLCLYKGMQVGKKPECNENNA